MKNACSGSAVIFMILVSSLIGCKKENEEVVVSFDLSTSAQQNWIVNETTPPGAPIPFVSVPTIAINKSLPHDLKVRLIDTGTATFGVDYTFPNPITIPAGKTTAFLNLVTIDDNIQEIDETTRLQIRSTDDASVKIDTASMGVRIVEDDFNGLGVRLSWDPHGATATMGIKIWRETLPGSGQFEVIGTSTGTGTVQTARLSLQEPDGLYALSYVYVIGSADNLTYDVILSTIGYTPLETVQHTSKKYNASYRLNNITSPNSTVKAQFFSKRGMWIEKVTSITVSPNGS